MTRRTCLPISALLLAACLPAAAVADDTNSAGVEVHEMIETMKNALFDNQPDTVRAFFDPKMAGFKRLSSDIGLLLKEARVPSSIEFAGNTGDAHARDVAMDWRMQVRAYNGETVVNRRAQVKLRAEKQDGHWRIVSFTPLDCFAPVRNSVVWDLITETLGALTEVSGDPNRHDGRVPARFLAAFDPKMPGFEQLRDNVNALEQQGDLESFVELVNSEGDDQHRSVELDWTLSLVHPRSGIGELRRHDRVTCEVEREHGKWRIVSFTPISFLAPEKPK
jgi:hypothetical protein